ncbi:MAG: ParB/RepB/Spo0J family partition protein [Thermomicrobiales bacterium]
MSSAAPVPELGASGTGGKRRFTVDALFVDHRPQAVGVEDLPTAKEIRLERVEADPDQPRRTFDSDRLAELVTSIRAEGVLQPIAVRYDADRDVYIVIHGERRLRAAREAGLVSIPAIVRDVPSDRRLIQQLMENVVREDLNAVDRAAALRTLKAQLGDVPWDAVAAAVGIRRSRLFQLLGTEKLPERIQDDIRAGRLSEKQSRALQGLRDDHQIALYEAMIEFDLGAEEGMALARAIKRDCQDAEIDVVRAYIGEQHGIAGASSAAADPLSQTAGLLAAIEAVAVGERGAQQALAAAAKSARAPEFDGRRLRAEVHTLARTLARIPAAELVPGGAAYMPLSMLRAALNAMLPPE